MTSDKMQLEADILREIAEQILDDVALLEATIITRATKQKRGKNKTKRHETTKTQNNIDKNTD